MNNKVSSWKMIIRNLFYVFFVGVALLCFSSSSSAWTWGPEEEIVGTLLASGKDSHVQKIVRDGDGNALAVFDTYNNDTDLLRVLAASSYTLGSGWSPAFPIITAHEPGADVPTKDFDVDMNDDGNHVIAVILDDVWPSFTHEIYARVTIDDQSATTYISTNVPEPPELWDHERHLMVAISENNDALLVWDNGNDIRFCMYRNGSWGTESLLDTDTAGVTQFSMDVDADGFGNFIVVWNRVGDSNLYGKRFLNGSWSSRETISTGTAPHPEGWARAAMFGNGEAVVVYEHWVAFPSPARYEVYGRYFNGSTWLTPQSVGTGDSTTRPSITAQSDGTALVVFRKDSAVQEQWDLYASRFEAGVWGVKEEIGCGFKGINFNIDMDGNGNAVVALEQVATYFVFKSYQDGLGWLQCAASGLPDQGWSSWYFESRTMAFTPENHDKRVVITPHEIHGVWEKAVGANPDLDTVHVVTSIKDVYINGFDTQTKSAIVDLDANLPYNSICGDSYPHCFTEMRFSNDGVNWSSWEDAPSEGGTCLPPYTMTRTNWDLTASAYGGNSTPGLKRVYIQFRNENCGSLVTHDEINYHPLSLCEGDFDGDGDVDGSDLGVFAAGGTGITLEDFAAEFGRTDCPLPDVDYWVSASQGSDSNPGTRDEPFKTISHALSAAGENKVIKVLPGTYDEGLGETFPLVLQTGQALVGDEGNKGDGVSPTLIIGQGDFEAGSFDYATIVGAEGSRVSGFKIGADPYTLFDFAIVVDGITMQISDNTFKASTYGGVLLRNNGTSLVEENVFDTTSYGIYIHFCVDGPIIRNNTLASHIDVVGPETYAVISGNTIETGDVGILVQHGHPLIENNTFNGGYYYAALWCQHQQANPTVRGNIFICNTAIAIEQDNNPDLGTASDFGDNDLSSVTGVSVTHEGTATLYAIGNTWPNWPPVEGTDIAISGTGTVVWGTGPGDHYP